MDRDPHRPGRQWTSDRALGAHRPAGHARPARDRAGARTRARHRLAAPAQAIARPPSSIAGGLSTYRRVPRDLTSARTTSEEVAPVTPLLARSERTDPDVMLFDHRYLRESAQRSGSVITPRHGWSTTGLWARPPDSIRHW